jgi:hypothetical protein
VFPSGRKTIGRAICYFARSGTGAISDHYLEMKRKILLLSFLSLLQFGLVHFFLIQRFANSGNEQAYLYQARLFSRGQLYVGLLLGYTSLVRYLDWIPMMAWIGFDL